MIKVQNSFDGNINIPYENIPIGQPFLGSFPPEGRSRGQILLWIKIADNWTIKLFRMDDFTLWYTGPYDGLVYSYKPVSITITTE